LVLGAGFCIKNILKEFYKGKVINKLANLFCDWSLFLHPRRFLQRICISKAKTEKPPYGGE